MKFIKISVLFGICVVLITSCNEKEKASVTNNISQNEGFFVVNEGTFGFGNSSLHFINLKDESKNTGNDLFFNANNRKIGDVFQSLNLINNNLWLVINNSGKIEVINPQNFKSIASIKNLKSPRYTLEVMTGKVYVSDLNSNFINIINSVDFSKKGEIKCAGWTEEMLLYEQKVWVTNHNSDYLYVINPQNDIITDSIKLAWGGSSLLSDKYGKIWVLCSGDLIKNKKGGLFCINAKNLKIEKEILFDKSDFNPFKIKQTANNDSILFICKGIYKFSKNDNIIPLMPFIKELSGSSFYGFTIDNNYGNIYVADAYDYVSNGKIHKYSPSGNFIKSFDGGVVPSDFMWW